MVRIGGLAAAVAMGVVVAAAPPVRASKVAGSVVVTGRAVIDKSPQAGLPVTVYTATERCGVIFCDDSLTSADKGTTGADGRFSLTVSAEALRLALDGLRVTVSRPKSGDELQGPSTTVSVGRPDADDGRVALGDVVLWNRPSRLVPDGTGPGLRVEHDLPRGFKGGQVSSSVDDDRVRYGLLDGRLVEDRQVELGATWRGRGITAASPRVMVRGTAVPLSRGKPCTAGPTSSPVAPCPLTDGSFDEPASKALDRDAPDMVIDLGAEVDVGLVVPQARTCSAFCADVSLSLDGQNWTPLKHLPFASALAPPGEQPVRARWVRVDEGLPAEVSVWGPPASVIEGEFEYNPWKRAGLIAVAGLILAVAGSAVFLVLLRRSRTR